MPVEKIDPESKTKRLIVLNIEAIRTHPSVQIVAIKIE